MGRKRRMSHTAGGAQGRACEGSESSQSNNNSPVRQGAPKLRPPGLGKAGALSVAPQEGPAAPSPSQAVPGAENKRLEVPATPRIHCGKSSSPPMRCESAQNATSTASTVSACPATVTSYPTMTAAFHCGFTSGSAPHEAVTGTLLKMPALLWLPPHPE